MFEYLIVLQSVTELGGFEFLRNPIIVSGQDFLRYPVFTRSLDGELLTFRISDQVVYSYKY
jgi:hypothetical protein